MPTALYREVRAAAGRLFVSDVLDPLAQFGLTDLLESGAVEERTGVFAIAEAQGRAGSTTDVVSRIALAGLGLGTSSAYGHHLAAGTETGPAICGLLGRTEPNGGTGIVATDGDGAVWWLRSLPGASIPSSLAPDYLTVHQLHPGPSRRIAIPSGTDLQARARLACAAEALGACESMLGTAVEYAKARKQFGAALANFQAVAHSLAWAATEIHQLRALLDVSLLGDPLLAPDPTLAAATKSMAGRVGRQVAQITLQVSGGIGFTWEYSHNGLHRRLLALDAVGGSAEAINLELGLGLRARSGADSDYPALIPLPALAAAALRSRNAERS